MATLSKELVWRAATRIELVNQTDYPVTSVAFSGAWVLARNENGTVAFPESQVLKVALG
ncbi:hypothetical protein [Catenulispora rubra]|uniref:hypothetical protein n=1 Tax=Catenulispora rubra TaxID=280293 RepID=UPI00189242C1|nr:hypothetical protein [Catenulispora rubra]